MRTYKEPKRIDKPRIIDPVINNQEPENFPLPCISNCGINNQGCSSPQQDTEKDEEGTVKLPDKEEETPITPEKELLKEIENKNVDDHSENEHDTEKDETSEKQNKTEDGVKDDVDETEKSEIKNSVSKPVKKAVKKKVVKDGQKKVVKKGKKANDDNKETVKEKEEIDDCELKEKSKENDESKMSTDDEVEGKTDKATPKKAKVIKKKKVTKTVNNKTPASKEKTSPKLTAKKKFPKAKKKLKSENSPDDCDTKTVEDDLDTDLLDKKLVTSSPRSSKRTPKKNRKYQTDEERLVDTVVEEESTTPESGSSGKKKSPKSPKGSAGKKRKLLFEETTETDKMDTNQNSDVVTPPKPKKKKKVVKKDETPNSDQISDPKDDEEMIVNDDGKTENVKSEASVPTKTKKPAKPRAKKKPKKEFTNENEEEKKDNVVTEGDITANNETKVKKKKVVRKRKLDTKNDTNENGGKVESSEVKPNNDDQQEKNEKPKVKRKRKKKVNDSTESKTGDVKCEPNEENKSEENKDESSLNISTDSSTKKESDDEPKKETEKKEKVKLVCVDCGHKAGGKAAYTKHLRKCVARDKICADSILQPRLEVPDHTPSSTAESDETVCYSENTPPASQPEIPLFKCQHCEYGTPKRAMLGRHMRTHGIYVCLRCNFICDTVDGLKDHMNREHKERTDFKLCRKCSRYIKCADTSIEQHMETCEGPVPFICTFCNKEFKYESSLKSHVVSHTPDAPKRFNCQQCDYKSNYKANLKKHLVNIHGDKVKRVKCEHEDCTKMFFTEDNMRRHLKWHSEDRPYKCTECDKAFKSKVALRGHSVIHDPTRPFKCNINDCQKDFRSKKLLKNHQAEFHNLTEKRHRCSFEGCTFEFFKKSHLARHVITHTGERKFGCRICGKAFRHSDNLKIHYRQHTNEKPIKCELCDFACRQKSSIRYHMKKFHGILPPTKEGNSNSNSLDELDMKCLLFESPNNNTQKTETEDSTTEPKAAEENVNTIKNDTKPLSPINSNNPMDLYEFRSDDEFGDDISALRQEKLMLTPRKINFAEFFSSVKDEAITSIKHEGVQKKVNSEENILTDKPKKKVLKKKKKIVKTDKNSMKKEPLEQTGQNVSGELEESEKVELGESESSKVLELKESESLVSKLPESTTEPPLKKKKKPGRKPKVTKPETEETSTKSPKSPKKTKTIEPVTKVPKKRGRKPKQKIVETVVKKKLGRPKKHPDKETAGVGIIKKSPPKKKKVVRRKKKVQKEKSPEKQSETVYNDDTEVEKEKEENSDIENNDIVKLDDIDNEQIMDKLSESPPSIKNESHYKSPKSEEEEEEEIEGVDSHKKDDENESVENVQDDVDKNENKEDKEEEKDTKDKDVNSDIEETVPQGDERKVNDNVSDGTSSGIDTDFEEELKPPPAPRPPPVVDSDEGDIESGPEDMDTPSRDFESTPPKSVAEPSPRVHHLSGTDTSPRIPSIPGMECKQDMNSSSEYIQHTPKDMVENEISDPASVKFTENTPLQNTQSPINESVPTVEASTNGTEFGSQSESTMPEVDKDYLGQYLQQFDSSTRSEDETGNRIDRIEATVVGRPSETINDISPTAHDKDLPPLNLSSSALNLTTTPERNDPMSNKRMEILECDRQQENHFQPRSDSAPRSPERSSDTAGYDSYSSINTFLPPTRDASLLRQGENLFPPTSANSSFMRFSESDALLQRQRMSTPFIGQSDPNALQNLHRMADSALASHNNPALLRRPTTVPPREDMFTSPAVAQTMTRNPFHNSWAGQEVRPAHWSQAPYLQRSIERQGGSTSSPLFGKDNYLAGREFMLDASRRTVAERNMFTGLPQSQRPDLTHESFPSLERFDFGYFGGHGYPGASSLDYSRSTCGTSQKTFDERYRQSATGVGDFRSLPQTSSADMFSGINMNSSFNLDKYMYSRDPVYHPPHMSESTNATFLPHGVPTQHTVFDRDYPRGFYQNTPYSFDKQYAAAAAASAKLGHTTGTSATSQERDFVPRQNASSENQMQDPYRHPMLYNMMNRYFE